MKFLLLLISFNCFAELSQQQVNANIRECGYESSEEFIADKSTACVDLNAWDYCPDTGIRHFNGMCDSMTQEIFLQTHEEVL